MNTPSSRPPHFAHTPDPRPPGTDPAEVARLREEVAQLTRELADTTGAVDPWTARDLAWRCLAVLGFVVFAAAALRVVGEFARLAR